MPTVKNVGEPCAGEPHARFEVAAGGNQASRAHTAARPRRLPPTLPPSITEINRFTVGWTAYYQLADTSWPFEELDKWLRRRLRQVRWKQWKLVRTRLHKLRAAGIPEADARRWANSRKGYWRISNSNVLHMALPNAYWADLGLKGFTDPYRRFRSC